MATQLPVPIEFTLPEQWRPADPDQVDAADAAFVALRPEPVSDFVANITISGELDASAKPLTAFADESLERLREKAPDVTLTKRTEVGSEQAPGLTQVTALTTDVNGTPRSLVQIHVFLAMPDGDDPAKRAIIELVLTSAEDEVAAVVGDFRDFVGSVAPHAG
jgi:hypothetical protein